MKNLPKAIDHVEVGDVFVSTWGYEQTNVDFYKVTRKTKAMIELSPIPCRVVDETGWASDRVVPDVNAAPGKSIGLRRPQVYGPADNRYVVCRIDYVSSATKINDPWSYKGTHRSWYA